VRVDPGAPTVDLQSRVLGAPAVQFWGNVDLRHGSQIWICADRLWTRQISESFRLVVTGMHAHTVMKFFL
jgi:hypothetical protein